MHIEPYDEGQSEEEPNEVEDHDALPNGDTSSEFVQRCEIREYEARYNLKGERNLKLVKEKTPKKDDDEGNDEHEALKYAFR